MDSFTDSLEDSRNESEVEKLRQEVKQKNKVIKENSTIIGSLREQVQEYSSTIDDLEKNEQLLKRDNDRFKKELAEKVDELEAVSHALKEVETANARLSERLEGRRGQLEKFVEDLTKAKKELEEVKELNEQLTSRNEMLSAQLESKELTLRRHKRDEEEPLTFELENLRFQVNSLKAQLMNESQKASRQQASYSKEIGDMKSFITSLREQNELLSSKLKAQPTKSNNEYSSMEMNSRQSNEELVQELYDLRAQVKSLSHRQSRRSIDEEIINLKNELDVTETSWKLEKQHKERYARENTLLDKKVNDLTKELSNLIERNKMYESKCRYLENQLQDLMPPPELPPKDIVRSAENRTQLADENKLDVMPIHFSMADEVGEIMDSSSIITKEKRHLKDLSYWEQQQQYEFRNKRAVPAMNESNRQPSKQEPESYCANHKIQKSQFLTQNDPIMEQKLRIERAAELARRNKLTKPLHQTSYALELETFDNINLTENDIKRGQVRRQALADFSNQRKPAKKAEAFIV